VAVTPQVTVTAQDRTMRPEDRLRRGAEQPAIREVLRESRRLPAELVPCVLTARSETRRATQPVVLESDAVRDVVVVQCRLQADQRAELIARDSGRSARAGDAHAPMGCVDDPKDPP